MAALIAQRRWHRLGVVIIGFRTVIHQRLFGIASIPKTHGFQRARGTCSSNIHMTGLPRRHFLDDSQ